MVESILYLVLGFLAASLAALAFLRAVWSRAVRLTTNRLAARLPVSPAMIAADRDRLRAAHAVELRRLERRIEAMASTHGPELVSVEDKAAIRRLTSELSEARLRLGQIETLRNAERREPTAHDPSSLRSALWTGAGRVVDLSRSAIGRLRGAGAADEATPAKVAALEAEIHSLLTIVGNLETELAARRQAEADPVPSKQTPSAPAAVDGRVDSELVVALAEQAADLEHRLEAETAALDSHRLAVGRLEAELMSRAEAQARAEQEWSARQEGQRQEIERLRTERETFAAELAAALEMLRAEGTAAEAGAEAAREERARLQQRIGDLERILAEKSGVEREENEVLRAQLMALASQIAERVREGGDEAVEAAEAVPELDAIGAAGGTPSR